MLSVVCVGEGIPEWSLKKNWNRKYDRCMMLRDVVVLEDREILPRSRLVRLTVFSCVGIEIGGGYSPTLNPMNNLI